MLKVSSSSAQFVIKPQHSYNKTNEMHKFLKFIFGIELYMFRTGFLSETCRVIFQK